MSGYHILGGQVPPYSVLQQQNAGLPPGSVPPWYAMQYPAGYVPPLLVSVDNPLEEDPFSANLDMLLRHHGGREREGLRKSHLLGEVETPYSPDVDAIIKHLDIHLIGFYGLLEDEVAVFGADGGSAAIVEVSRLLNRIYAHREKDPAGGPDLLRPNVVTYEAARDLVQKALPAIDQAKKIAPAGWFVPTKEKTMANIRDALVRHEQAIAAGLAEGRAGAYPEAEALRKDVLKAFIEVEGSITGAEAQERLSYWTKVYKFLQDIGDTVLAAAKAANAAVQDLAGGVSRGAKIASVVLLGLLGLLGYAAYKILIAAAPGVAPVLTARYLR